MFKITAKTTKATLKEILNANFAQVKKADDTLASQIKYAGEHEDKATRKDLVDLVKDVMTTLGDAFIVPAVAENKPVAENSVKKPVKKTEEVSEETAEDEDKADDEDEEVSEKTTVAKKPKKSAKKADGVTALDTKSEKAVQMVKQFPETIEIDGETFKLNHEIKTMKDLLEAYMNDVEIEFAFYWTKRHLRQFDYYNHKFGQPKSFPNDLDTAQLVFVDDQNMKVAYCVSDSNFPAPYSIFPEDLEEDDGIRYASGIEYQIYTK